MIVTVSPSKIDGNIAMPPSKSSMQRACAAALLTPATTILSYCGRSNDEQAALGIIEALGARVVHENGNVVVTSSREILTDVKPRTVSCGESGLSMRMFAPVAALFSCPVTFVGEGSILTRPMDFFDEVLPKLNVKVESNGGRLPLKVQGPLRPRDITVDGSLSSQFLTGLLFAYAQAATEPVTITVTDLKSRPYIDLTLDVLEKFGFRVEHTNYEKFAILPAKETIAPVREYTVEGDWSNAAFLLVAGVIAGKISLTNVNFNSPQGDKQILDALRYSGADIAFVGDRIDTRQSALNGFEFDATHCPDLFPPLVALAVNCEGTTTIRGVERLLHKESNRAETLTSEFTKLGGRIQYEGDYMQITGLGVMRGAKVSSHNDHRIAMAAAVAALKCAGPVEISNAHAVNKSYPQFYDDLRSLGAHVDIRS